MDAEFQELVAKGKKSQQEVDSMIQLANEVQYSILTKKLNPGAYSSSSDFCFSIRIVAESGFLVFINILLGVSYADILQPYGFPASRRRASAHLTRYRADDGP